MKSKHNGWVNEQKDNFLGEGLIKLQCAEATRRLAREKMRVVWDDVGSAWALLWESKTSHRSLRTAMPHTPRWAQTSKNKISLVKDSFYFSTHANTRPLTSAMGIVHWETNYLCSLRGGLSFSWKPVCVLVSNHLLPLDQCSSSGQMAMKWWHAKFISTDLKSSDTSWQQEESATSVARIRQDQGFIGIAVAKEHSIAMQMSQTQLFTKVLCHVTVSSEVDVPVPPRRKKGAISGQEYLPLEGAVIHPHNDTKGILNAWLDPDTKKLCREFLLGFLVTADGPLELSLRVPSTCHWWPLDPGLHSSILTQRTPNFYLGRYCKVHCAYKGIYDDRCG